MCCPIVQRVTNVNKWNTGIAHGEESYHICVCFDWVFDDTCIFRQRALVPDAVQLNQGLAAVVASEFTVDAAQTLLVQPPDEVPTQITPGGLSVAAGLEVVALSTLLDRLGVAAAA